ncbi:hypothetical protein B9Z55_010510 [Caenorhabditis nigoni]|nr:hypothetical protein B9Z55_010510 [Caenorhabditis nigoni]
MSQVDTTYQGRQTYRAVPKTGVTRPASQPVKTQAKPTPTPTAIVNNPHSGQRPLVKPIPKPAETPKPASSSVLTSAPASTIPSTSSSTRTSFDVRKPPPVNGFDYFDTTEEACNARFNAFAAKYRKENPTCIFSQKCFEGCLKVKYLNTVTEQLSAIKVAQN